jgi:16S rRNA (cytosine1402-N4)-methyltransferase
MIHVPVLLNETLQALTLAPRETEVDPRTLRGLDCTFGRGGHTRALLTQFPNLHLTSLDRDPQAIEYGQAQCADLISSQRLELKHISFQDFATQLDSAVRFDLILMDLGVSSPQLDQPERGFSLRHDGPLDMRMNPKDSISAATIVNQSEEEELLQIFRELGEVTKPQRVVRAILNDRGTTPFTTTRQLASLIERVDGWTKKGFHPATLYFMGLRMAVNREIEQLSIALPLLMESLTEGGRMAVITFHSIEDRIVKNAFRNSSIGNALNNSVITPNAEEETQNSRARSAKLRVFERGLESGPRKKKDKYAHLKEDKNGRT